MVLSKVIRGISKLKGNVSNRTDRLKHTTTRKREPHHTTMQRWDLQKKHIRNRQKQKTEHQTMFYAQSGVLPTNPNPVKPYPNYFSSGLFGGMNKNPRAVPDAIKLAWHGGRRKKTREEKDFDRFEADYEAWTGLDGGEGMDRAYGVGR
jgi:hypothetical protein